MGTTEDNPKTEYTKEEKHALALSTEKALAALETAMNDCHKAGLHVSLIRNADEVGRTQFKIHIVDTFCFICGKHGHEGH